MSLTLNSSAAISQDGGVPTIEMQSGEMRLLELVVVGAASGPVHFTVANLPGFATLQGPLLTLAPARKDAGHYFFTVTASAVADSTSVALGVTVLRANTAPVWQSNNSVPSVLLADDNAATREAERFPPICPGTRCTAHGVATLKFPACDAEGDRIVAEVEVVARGHAFSGIATQTSSAVPGGPPYNCATVAVVLSGLAPQQSYDFAARVSDEYGAVAVVNYAGSNALGDGWVHFPAYTFDQGPCTTRQCACAPFDSACEVADDCCSGVCAPDYVRMFSYCK